MEGLNLFSILKNASYRKLWLSQVISELGDGITSLLILYLASKTSDSPLVFSYVLIARYLPNVILGTFVGPIVDKFPKKRVMILADIYRFVILIGMIFAQSSLVLLILFTLLLGVGTVFFEPAKSATIPRIMDNESIPNAVSLSQSTTMAISIIAPSIGGVLLLTKHYSFMLILDSLTFLLSALILFFIRIPSDICSKEGEKQKQSYKEALKEGVKTISSSTVLIGLFSLLIVGIFVFSFINTNIYPLLLNDFKVGELHFGTLQTVFGFTAVVGSLLVPKIMEKIKSSSLVIFTFIFIGIMCFLVIPTYKAHLLLPLVPVYIWLAIIGFTNTFINVPVNSLLLQSVPKEVLGRVTGILMTVINLSSLIGLYSGGFIADHIGSIWAIVIGGACLLVFSLVFPLTKYYKSLHIKNEKSSIEEMKGVSVEES